MGVYLSDNQELDPSFRRNPWNIEAVNSPALAVLWVVAVGLTPSTRQRPARPGSRASDTNTAARHCGHAQPQGHEAAHSHAQH